MDDVYWSKPIFLRGAGVEVKSSTFAANSASDSFMASICAPTKICEITDGRIETYTVSPEDFGFVPCDMSEVRVGTPEYNAQAIPYADKALPANTLIATAVSDKQGKLSFHGKLPVGNYYLQEISGPEGWELDDTQHGISLPADAKVADREMMVHFEKPIVNRLIQTDTDCRITADHGKTYGIQRINAYHRTLKDFLRGFHGVSTKHLGNYLVWNGVIRYKRRGVGICCFQKNTGSKPAAAEAFSGRSTATATVPRTCPTPSIT